MAVPAQMPQPLQTAGSSFFRPVVPNLPNAATLNIVAHVVVIFGATPQL